MKQRASEEKGAGRGEARPKAVVGGVGVVNKTGGLQLRHRYDGLRKPCVVLLLGRMKRATGEEKRGGGGDGGGGEERGGNEGAAGGREKEREVEERERAR